LLFEQRYKNRLLFYFSFLSNDDKIFAQVRAEAEANYKAAKERAECIASVRWVEAFRIWFQQNRSHIFDTLRVFDQDGLPLCSYEMDFGLPSSSAMAYNFGYL
jgi:hypothetical protein